MTLIRHLKDNRVLFDSGDTTLASISLDGMNFAFADLRNLDLRGASLVGADLCNAELTGVCFSHADLRRADLTASRCGGADFSGAQLADAKLLAAKGAEDPRSPTSFRGAECTRAMFQHADLRRADFRDAVLVRADLRHAALHNATFDGANMESADLSFANLKDTSLVGVALRGGLLNDTVLTGARLHEADLSLANCNGVDCAAADFTNARWSRTVWAHSPALASAVGLDSLRLGAPSAMDAVTLHAIFDQLPDVVLTHVGIPVGQRAAWRSLLAAP